MSTFNKFILTVIFVWLSYYCYITNREFLQVHNTDNFKSTARYMSFKENLGPCQKDMCLSCVLKGVELQKLVNLTQNVIILMPAKAAGTSFESFARQCSGKSYSKLKDNFLNFEIGESFLTSSFELPQVIASHMYNAEPMMKLFQHASKDTLFIWSHREETSRLVSAITHVMKRLCVHPRYYEMAKFRFVERTKKKCVFSERDLINNIIKKKNIEIGFGMEQILSCDAYDAIRNHSPNLILADYNEADKIQQHVARKHCPKLLKKRAVRENVATDFKTKMYVKLSEVDNVLGVSNRTVSLNDWLKVKRSYIEMSLELKEDVTCQDRTRRLEHILDNCDDHIVQMARLGSENSQVISDQSYF